VVLPAPSPYHQIVYYLLHRIALLHIYRCSLLYVDAACCYQPSSVVCQSVTLVSPAKTDAPIEMSFVLRTRVGRGNYVLDGGPHPPWEGAILRGDATHCKVQEHSAVICAKTAEPIKMFVWVVDLPWHCCLPVLCKSSAVAYSR